MIYTHITEAVAPLIDWWAMRVCVWPFYTRRNTDNQSFSIAFFRPSRNAVRCTVKIGRGNTIRTTPMLYHINFNCLFKIFFCFFLKYFVSFTQLFPVKLRDLLNWIFVLSTSISKLELQPNQASTKQCADDRRLDSDLILVHQRDWSWECVGPVIVVLEALLLDAKVSGLSF